MNATASDSPGPRLTPRALLGLLALVLACRVLAWRACPLYDDAFITYRYARNLAQGQGLVFNPGAPWEPVLGTTTPLYALVLGGLSWLGCELTIAARVLNLACDLASAWLIARGLGLERRAATLALCAFAALPQLERISAGGMESPLFLLLALASAHDLAARRPLRAGIWAALDCLVRPEGVLLVLVCAAELVRRPRELVRLLAPVVVIGALSAAALIQVYGSPIPQSVQAKAHMQASAWERLAPILAHSFAPHPLLWMLLPLAALGFARLLAGPGPLRPLVAFSLAITASYLLARPHVWGWYFYVPLTAWAIALARGFEELARRSVLLARLPLAATAALALLMVGLASALRPSPIPEQVYAPLQAWARVTSEREPAARILASDIGAIGWAWRGTVLDSEGLTWPPALDFAHPNAIVHAHRPEYLLIVAEHDRVAPLYEDAELLARYEPIERFSPGGERELHPALDTLPPRWVQDYLVYRRKAGAR